MGYTNLNFSFNPSNNPLGFNGNPFTLVDRSSNSPVNNTNNPYVPTCDSNLLIKQGHAAQVDELVRNSGMTITYLPMKYNTKVANFLYGEDPISGFVQGRLMKAIINFSSYQTFLTKFGNMSNSGITIFIPIKEFARVWGPQNGQNGIYPLAGDLFYINDEACDRPLQQSPMVFQVTDKDDKESPVDFLAGHYIYKLDATRFDYSYEKDAPEEKYLDNTTSDNKVFGRLPGGDNPPDLSSREYDVDDFAKGNFIQPDSGTYGTYL